MSKLVVLDTAVLGLIASPNTVISSPLLLWLKQLLRQGHLPIVPEIADYELRRELIRLSSRKAIATLDRFSQGANYLPIDTYVMRRAAELWAQARSQGRPFAHDHALDGDVILCAQAQLLAEAHPRDEVIVATTNLAHIRRFVKADQWQDI